MADYTPRLKASYKDVVRPAMKEEFAYIKFYNDENGQMTIEEFHGKSLGYVEDAAENWALGVKKVAGIS